MGGFTELLAVCLWVMLDNANRLTKTQVSRFESRKLAEELRRSSDDLTRMARTYAVTGDVRFKHYFESIAAIRDGKELRPQSYQNIFWDFITADHNYRTSIGRKVSITTLMKELHFSKGELSVLAEAKMLSDNLIKMEIQAFNALNGRFLGSDGKYSKNDEPNQEMALQILHGEAYHQAKARIMGKVNEFFKLLELRTLNDVIRNESAQERAHIFAIALAALLVTLSILGYYYFIRDIVFPLNNLRKKVKQMQSGTYKFKDIPRNDEIGLLMHTFVDMANTISKTIDGLDYLSHIDQLTKINNRIALDEILNKENYKFDRYHTDCSLILVDIDHFKEVNDQFGHIVGDNVLVEMANILRKSIRASDIAGRWGGEEFLIICPNTALEETKIVAESVRKKISDFLFPEVGHRTASFGISTFKETLDLVAVIDEADNALYKAKENGRNRVY